MATAAAKATAEGSILEIGCYKGKSTIAIAMAKRLADMALAGARRVRDGALVKKVMAARTAVTQAEQAFAEVEKGLDTLNQKPTATPRP